MTRRAGLDSTAVINSAADLIDEQGLEVLSLTTLADRLGVKVPSLYNHVAGLAGLRQQLVLLGTRQLAARLAQAAVGQSGDAAVRAIADAYRAYVHQRPGLYAVSIQAAPADEELLAAQAEAVATVVKVLEFYNLSGDDALHTVRALRSLVHGFASLEVNGGFGLALDLDESFRRVISYFLDGLHTGRSAAS